MSTLKGILEKRTDGREPEQALRDILSANIKKYRRRRAYSQFALAAKADISTNFLADIEAGNTWVSALTLIKLAQAFDVEVYELLKPEKEGKPAGNTKESGKVQAIIDRFSADLTVVLKDSVEKAVGRVRKEYGE